MEVNDADGQLLKLLAADPLGRRELIKHGRRVMPDHPIVQQESANEVSFEERVKPLQEEIKELRTQLQEKTGRDMWEARREELRKAPFYFTDEQILEFEDRLRKDGNQYKSYTEAARYYQYQDQPTHPASAPNGLSPFGRRTQKEQDWRNMIKDPTSRLWKDRKNFMREQWEEGSRELSNRRR